MNRERMIREIEEQPDNWDVIIIGGGATGLGAAVDAASRGLRTLLLEQDDFAKGTSSRSTKLIHGGLRYLQQGNIGLVTEALKERGLLCQNAPHLVYHLPFLVPNYHWWEGPFYGIGLKVYDMLAGSLGIEKSKRLSKDQILEAIPTIETKDLRGGVIYYDGQFDDARLAITLAKTAASKQGFLINYMKVKGLIKKNEIIVGVKAQDLETGKTYNLHSKTVINATGVFSDEVLRMDDKQAKQLIAPSQGIHIVLPKSFQPGDMALLIPHTEDNRVIFLVPWHDRVLVGTTDTSIKKPSLEPKPLEEEIEFLLKHASIYLKKDPKREDILSVFTGLRPLIKGDDEKETASLSRDHTILVSSSGLITIAGGKWTTYRKMAEDVIDKAIEVGNLPERNCITKSLKLAGFEESLNPLSHLNLYGSDKKFLKEEIKKDKSLKEYLHPNLPYLWVEVIWAIQKEMARTVEDILSRRTRSLLLDAKASIEIAPKIAECLTKELNKNKEWEKAQVESFLKIAKNYLA